MPNTLLKTKTSQIIGLELFGTTPDEQVTIRTRDLAPEAMGMGQDMFTMPKSDFDQAGLVIGTGIAITYSKVSG